MHRTDRTVAGAGAGAGACSGAAAAAAARPTQLLFSSAPDTEISYQQADLKQVQDSNAVAGPGRKRARRGVAVRVRSIHGEQLISTRVHCLCLTYVSQINTRQVSTLLHPGMELSVFVTKERLISPRSPAQMWREGNGGPACCPGS